MVSWSLATRQVRPDMHVVCTWLLAPYSCLNGPVIHDIMDVTCVTVGDYPRSKMLDDPALAQVAQKHNVTVGQVALRWGLQKMNDNGIVIPRSHNITHMEENIHALSFKLDQDDMDSLQNLPQSKVYDTQCQPWC
eukprot:TRINITY_DN6870_c0_g1_i2.p1 TRINITY_DN6870_c0_g1~~TRINITY_DN6870_c0_g1_i2.p1  ORF type:complete len:135 (+),score=20.30 TRINITY_DN6870_c0_g1_i2:65-469(+)